MSTYANLANLGLSSSIHYIGRFDSMEEAKFYLDKRNLYEPQLFIVNGVQYTYIDHEINAFAIMEDENKPFNKIIEKIWN